MESYRIDHFSQWTAALRRKLPGIIFTLLCAFSFSSGDLLLYSAVQDFHPCLVFLFNSNISFFLCILLCLTLRPRIPTTTTQLLLVVTHGSLYCISQLSIATAVFSIGPAIAVALFFTVPIFTTVCSVLILRTRLHVTSVFFTTCSTLGVALLTRYLATIGDEALNEKLPVAVGIVSALAAAMAYAGGLVVGRALAKFETQSLINVFSFSFQYSIASVVLCSFFNAWEAPETLSSLALLVGTGLSTFSGMMFGYLAVCFEKPTIVSILLTSEVIISIIGQFTLFNFPFYWTVPVGSILIVFSCVGITLFESQNEDNNDEDNSSEDEGCPIVEQSTAN